MGLTEARCCLFDRSCLFILYILQLPLYLLVNFEKTIEINSLDLWTMFVKVWSENLPASESPEVGVEKVHLRTYQDLSNKTVRGGALL